MKYLYATVCCALRVKLKVSHFRSRLLVRSNREGGYWSSPNREAGCQSGRLMAVNLSMPRSAQICPAVRVRKSTITNAVQNIWIIMINFLNYIHEYLVLKPPSLKAVLSFTQEQDQCMVMTKRKVTLYFLHNTILTCDKSDIIVCDQQSLTTCATCVASVMQEVSHVTY